MLRFLLIFLLAANILVFLIGSGEKKTEAPLPTIAEHQITLIKNNPSQDSSAPSASGHVDASALGASACIEWGPHQETQITSARGALLSIGARRFEENVRMVNISSWWVNIEGIATRRDADAMVTSLKSQGVTDISVLEVQQLFVLSLGVFSSEDGANARLKELQDIGIKDAQITPRGTSAVFFHVNDLDQDQITQLRQIASTLRQSEIQMVSCETPSET